MNQNLEKLESYLKYILQDVTVNKNTDFVNKEFTEYIQISLSNWQKQEENQFKIKEIQNDYLHNTEIILKNVNKFNETQFNTFKNLIEKDNILKYRMGFYNLETYSFEFYKLLTEEYLEYKDKIECISKKKEYISKRTYEVMTNLLMKIYTNPHKTITKEYIPFLQELLNDFKFVKNNILFVKDMKYNYIDSLEKFWKKEYNRAYSILSITETYDKFVKSKDYKEKDNMLKEIKKRKDLHISLFPNDVNVFKLT